MNLGSVIPKDDRQTLRPFAVKKVVIGNETVPASHTHGRLSYRPKQPQDPAGGTLGLLNGIYDQPVNQKALKNYPQHKRYF